MIEIDVSQYLWFSVITFYIWNQISYSRLICPLFVWGLITIFCFINFFVCVKVSDVLPPSSQNLSVDKIHEACRLWHIQIKEDRFPRKQWIREKEPVEWPLTANPSHFMAFFLCWVIVYSCKIQNHITCNQVWTPETPVSRFQDSQIPSQSQDCPSHSIFVNSVASLWNKLLFALVYKISNVATNDRQQAHLRSWCQKTLALLVIVQLVNVFIAVNMYNLC